MPCKELRGRYCNVRVLQYNVSGYNIPLARVADFVSDEAFDGGVVVLLDSENLLIPDSVGTRGRHST